jgi:hypothetical protein
MEFTALNLSLVIAILIILFVILGILIFKVCRQGSHDVIYSRKANNLKEITQTDSNRPSLKSLEADDIKGESLFIEKEIG